MAGYTPLFDATLVASLQELVVRLDDPARVDPLPIVRPGVARHARHLLVILDLTGAGQIPLRAPVDGVARRVRLRADTPLPGGANEMLEIVPTPFAGSGSARGAPTFYLAPFDADPPDDERIGGGDLVAAIATRIFLAARFQDAFTPAPYDWLRAIAATLPTEQQAAWLAQETVYGTRERLRVTDQAGAPAEGSSFAITLRRDGDDGIEGEWDVAVDARSDLAQTIRPSGHSDRAEAVLRHAQRSESGAMHPRED
jgi:hypothetical protein